ncbi:MAG TPA: DUF748 domain-containing protein, partial [Acidobacteriota bacterium]|nr:DUF748 domain-containing protein [Acidobacteriota bacterium]
MATVRKIFKISGLVLGGLVILVAAAALLVVFDKPLVRKIVRGQLGKVPGTTVRYAKLDYSLFPLRISAEGLELVQETPFQKITLTLPRLEARGAVSKLVRGIKPALDSLAIDGVSFRLEQKAASEEPFDLEALLVQATDTLAWAKQISLTNARISISLLAFRADLENLDVTLEPGPGDVVAYAIGRSTISAGARSGAFGLTTSLGSSGTLRLISPFSLEARFAFGSPRVSSDGTDYALDALTLTAAARLDTAAGDFAVSRLEVAAPGLVEVKGKAAGRLGRSVFVEAEAEARIESLEQAAGLLGPRLPAVIRNAGLKGKVGVAGKYGLHRTNEETTDAIDAALSLEDVGFDQSIGGRPVHIRAAGRITAGGPTSDPRLSADLRATVGKLSVSGIVVGGSNLHLTAAGTRRAVSISGLEARLAGLVYAAAEGKTVTFDKATLAAKGTLDLAGKTATLTSLEAAFPGLAPIRLSGGLGFGRDRSARLELASRGLDLAALRAVAAPFLPAALAGWELAAKADLSLAYRRGRSASDWTASGTLSLSDATFNDPSFTIAGEKLDPSLRFEAVGSSKGLMIKGGLDIGHGESLWKSVYISWGQHPLALSVSGRYDPASGLVDGLAARALLPEIGTIDATGTARLLQSPTFDLGLVADLTLGPLYSLTAQPGAAAASRMKLEGRLGADVRLRKDGPALSAVGRIRLADAALERP